MGVCTELALIWEDANGALYWWDCVDEWEGDGDRLYAVDKNECKLWHKSEKSAVYDDMAGYHDYLQCGDQLLDDGELYAVLWFEYDEGDFLEQRVDFGLTKQEIEANVRANKYVEGAEYYTMGQVLKTTRDWLEGKLDD